MLGTGKVDHLEGGGGRLEGRLSWGCWRCTWVATSTPWWMSRPGPLAHHFHGLAGEGRPCWIGEPRQADGPSLVDAAADARCPDRRGQGLGLVVVDADDGAVLGQAEPLRRRGHAKGLEGALGVVVGDPGVEGGLGRRQQRLEAAISDATVIPVIDQLITQVAAFGR